MKNFLKYFLQGLIIFIPLIITGAILLQLFNFFSGAFSFLGLSENPVLNTLLGLAFSLGLIFLIGLLASSFLLRPVFSFFEDKLEHAPFIRHIYSPVKDFTNAFMGNKRRFNRPVMVLTNPLAGIYEFGFITRDDLSDLNMSDKVAVYMPMSYSLSGKLILVPKENIKPLAMDPSEAMKFVVSGGVTDRD